MICEEVLRSRDEIEGMFTKIGNELNKVDGEDAQLEGMYETLRWVTGERDSLDEFFDLD